VISLSCEGAGYCSAGGFYGSAAFGHTQAFVAGQANDSWGTAVEVPGTAALNKRGVGELTSVSCASSGNCSAGGSYTDGSGGQAFVADEVNGIWRTAEEAPGTAALNTGGRAAVTSVSCASAGNCSAGGHYTDGSGHFEAFVVSEVNGAWGTAVEVPGTAALNGGGNAGIASVSCAAAGHCGAGGFYTDRSGNEQAFVASQADGAWGAAVEVPGTSALNKAGVAAVASVSCASAGNCGAGGSYLAAPGQLQAFVADEVNGAWRTAEKVPGIAALNKGGSAGIDSISCAPAGECGAGGSYTDDSGHGQAFVVTRT
jgi:hypothetical protein